jgi:hypothetical protein
MSVRGGVEWRVGLARRCILAIILKFHMLFI